MLWFQVLGFEVYVLKLGLAVYVSLSRGVAAYAHVIFKKKQVKRKGFKKKFAHAYRFAC